MGRKSSSKGQGLQATVPNRPRKGFNPLMLGAVLVAILAVGIVAFWARSDPAQPGAATAGTEAGAQNASVPTPAIIAKTEAAAKLGPRPQTQLPPIPFQGYAPPRPTEVITAAYEFAAEHPEILGYVPCFCGCEHSGHSGNADCFVRERAPNGDVVAWDEHGVECTVCIDVANRSRQMYASGASVRDIRAAIEKEFGPLYPGRTPTPPAPAASN